MQNIQVLKDIKTRLINDGTNHDKVVSEEARAEEACIVNVSDVQ